jgi:hypothetical protein
MNLVAHDHQLRELLKSHLQGKVGPGDLLVDEFLLAYGAVRADVALVNGHLEGFEIKAGKDTLARLPSQVDAYNRVFEYSWVVTTAEHLRGVRCIVPLSWGLMIAAGDGADLALKKVRQAKRNARRDGEHLARLLWRGELVAKLQELGVLRGLKSKPKVALYAALAEALPVQELADYVRNCLKTRSDWRAGEAPRECGDSSHPASTA